MLVFDSVDLMQWLAQFFLPFFRIAAFFATVPIFGNQLVPIQIRLAIALATGVLLFSVIPVIEITNLFSIDMVVIVFQQVLIGVALGFFVQLFFHIFVLAGQMIAMQMGLGFASMIDPTNGVSVAVLSQFYVILVTMLFLSFDGHLVLIEVLVESFRFIPIGMNGLSSNALSLINSGAVWMLASAFLLALPAVSAILIVNFAFGVMTRAAPQLNVFSLGFPFTLVFGMFILWVSIAGFMPQYQNLSEEVFAWLHRIIESR